jgi:hypothetical protein
MEAMDADLLVLGLLHAPRSGYEPRRGYFSPDSTLRLTAWLRPVESSDTHTVRIAYDWETKSSGGSSGTLLMLDENQSTFSTTDPQTLIVAVLPFARVVNGKPRGRIVWQANDDVYVAEVRYELQAGSAPYAPQVIRATPQGSVIAGKGLYPTRLTEVSITGDVIAWSYQGRIHAARWQP